MTLDQAREHVGHKVIYRSKGGNLTEEGVITGFNDSFIFVRYGSQVTSSATYPADLTLLAGDPR